MKFDYLFDVYRLENQKSRKKEKKKNFVQNAFLIVTTSINVNIYIS